MTEAEFTELVSGLRREASHWFNNEALLRLEQLIAFAEFGWTCADRSEKPIRSLPQGPLDNSPSGA